MINYESISQGFFPVLVFLGICFALIGLGSGKIFWFLIGGSFVLLGYAMMDSIEGEK